MMSDDYITITRKVLRRLAEESIDSSGALRPIQTRELRKVAETAKKITIGTWWTDEHGGAGCLVGTALNNNPCLARFSGLVNTPNPGRLTDVGAIFDGLLRSHLHHEGFELGIGPWYLVRVSD